MIESITPAKSTHSLILTSLA